MAIKFNCSCGREMNVKDSLAGKKGKCPACGKIVEVPALGEEEAAPVEAPAVVAPSPAPEVRTKPCQHCRKPIPVDAVFCTHCGTHLRTGKKHQPEDRVETDTEDYNFFKTAPELLTKPMEAVGVIVDAPLSTANLRKALILLAVAMFFFTWVVPLNNEEAIQCGVLKRGDVWNPALALPLALVLGLIGLITDALICNIGGTMFGTTGAEISSVFMAIVAVRALLGLALIPFWIYAIVPGLAPWAAIMAWGPRLIRILWGTGLMYCVMMRSYDCGVVPALVFAASTTIVQALLFWLPGLILGFFGISLKLI